MQMWGNDGTSGQLAGGGIAGISVFIPAIPSPLFFCSPHISFFPINLLFYNLDINFALSASGIFKASIARSADHFVVSIKLLIV